MQLLNKSIVIKVLPQEGEFGFWFPALNTALTFWLFLVKASFSRGWCVHNFQFYGSFTDSKMLFTKGAVSDGDNPMKNSLFSMGAVSDDTLLRYLPSPWYDVQNQSMQGPDYIPGATKPLGPFLNIKYFLSSCHTHQQECKDCTRLFRFSFR